MNSDAICYVQMQRSLHLLILGSQRTGSLPACACACACAVCSRRLDELGAELARVLHDQPARNGALNQPNMEFTAELPLPPIRYAGHGHIKAAVKTHRHTADPLGSTPWPLSCVLLCHSAPLLCS